MLSLSFLLMAIHACIPGLIQNAPKCGLVPSTGRRLAAAFIAAFILPLQEESQVTPQGATAWVGFEQETNCFQFYAIANLDKTSLRSPAAT